MPRGSCDRTRGNTNPTSCPAATQATPNSSPSEQPTNPGPHTPHSACVSRLHCLGTNVQSTGRGDMRRPLVHLISAPPCFASDILEWPQTWTPRSDGRPHAGWQGPHVTSKGIGMGTGRPVSLKGSDLWGTCMSRNGLWRAFWLKLPDLRRRLRLDSPWSYSQSWGLASRRTHFLTVHSCIPTSPPIMSSEHGTVSCEHGRC